jgi:hypothetical protein
MVCTGLFKNVKEVHPGDSSRRSEPGVRPGSVRHVVQPA